jgi:hypothetical protein
MFRCKCGSKFFVLFLSSKILEIMRRNCSHKIQKNTRKKLESLFVAVFEPMVVDGVRSEGYGGGVFGYLDFPSFLGVSGNGKNIIYFRMQQILAK